MKILNKKETIEAEQKAIEKGISALRLMENAGSAAAKQLDKISGKIVILAGSGNNGGDGFVVARKLKLKGIQVSVILVTGTPKSEEALISYNLMLDSGIKPYDLFSERSVCEKIISSADVIIDAILGTGTKGAVTGLIAEAISFCNNSSAYKIALDIPTGLVCDSGEVLGPVFKANKTFSFIGLKPTHVLNPSACFCGEVKALSIGIDEALITGGINVIDKPVIKDIPLFSNKYQRGVLAIDAGEKGFAGAAYFAAKAASLSGVGLIKMPLKEDIYNLLSTLCPYAIFLKGKEFLNKATALIIGPGLVNNVDLSYIDGTIPTVLDAGGINALKDNIDILERFGNKIIITPHSGELARFLDVSVKEIENDRVKYAKLLSQKYGCITVLKGAFTVIASKEEVFINTFSHPCLSTAGSGDVLAGIIGAFLANGASLLDAAKNAVYVHGLCGKISFQENSISVNAETILNYLPKAFKKLKGIDLSEKNSSFN